MDAVHERLICEEETVVAERLVGVVGFSVSGAGVVEEGMLERSEVLGTSSDVFRAK